VTSSQHMFDVAHAWLRAFTRTPTSPTQDGPPSAWSPSTQERALNEAVVACLAEDETGACECASGCGSSAFIGPIGGWNVAGVTDMMYTFYDASTFNQDISAWDTSNVKTMHGMFANANAFDKDISVWNTSSVTTMYAMFYNAGAFDQDISAWDTSSVTNMGWM